LTICLDVLYWAYLQFTFYASNIMIIGACTVELRLPGNHSLKGKRHILKPLLNRLRREFNLAAAEVAHNDLWQLAEIAFVTVANDPIYVHTLLDKAVRWIEIYRPDVQVVDWQIEIL
jgi:uncharacterized protein YlxP (DUF503 family)